jgi:putative FmdB family regulatory protein
VQFERHQSFTDEPLKRCPECSKNSLRKVLTPAGIIFKGSGWYATDHKSPSGQGRLSAKNENKEGVSASESSGSSDKSESSGSSDSKKESSNSSSKSESSSGSTAKTESSSKSNE